uniref:Uncharacterized protein n=1 Tax=Euplotes harpa TaxID=151035 RepID=A0A7S3JKG5_9SPIT|mmetsp:Transcript_6271/g.7213  ORF Transcript_6271/g.7213 Transcript_6271/m.7213 type:complete len:109 (+) Transcript_6271:2-328(+)
MSRIISAEICDFNDGEAPIVNRKKLSISIPVNNDDYGKIEEDDTSQNSDQTQGLSNQRTQVPTETHYGREELDQVFQLNDLRPNYDSGKSSSSGVKAIKILRKSVPFV